MAEEPLSPLEALLEAWVEFGPREQRVLSDFVRRLLIGQRSYGQLAYKKKNWARETYEENLDSTVYSLCGLLDLAEGEPK